MQFPAATECLGVWELLSPQFHPASFLTQAGAPILGYIHCLALCFVPSGVYATQQQDGTPNHRVLCRRQSAVLEWALLFLSWSGCALKVLYIVFLQHLFLLFSLNVDLENQYCFRSFFPKGRLFLIMQTINCDMLLSSIVGNKPDWSSVNWLKSEVCIWLEDAPSILSSQSGKHKALKLDSWHHKIYTKCPLSEQSGGLDRRNTSLQSSSPTYEVGACLEHMSYSAKKHKQNKSKI
jgi:hypothetical protein